MHCENQEYLDKHDIHFTNDSMMIRIYHDKTNFNFIDIPSKLAYIMGT